MKVVDPSQTRTPRRRGIPGPFRLMRHGFHAFFARVKRVLPKSLFGRALIIVVAPLVLTNAIVTNVFFDSQWDEATRRLSLATAGDIAALIELYERAPSPAAVTEIDQFVRRNMDLSVTLTPGEELPATNPQSFFSNLDRTLRRALAARLHRPFWFDTTNYPDYIDFRVKVDAGVLRIISERKRVFASGGYVFVIWMIITSLILLTIAIIYLRNQVRPIQRLARAAESFGKGQEARDFKPSGAREVRSAAAAFIDMSRRIRRHIDQRTEMLAGVSHDLRTPITRLKLELAMMPESAERTAMEADLAEMENMLEEYLAFARGEGGEQPEPVAMRPFLESLAHDAARSSAPIAVDLPTVLPVLVVRPRALRRCLQNLIDNALDHGEGAGVRLAVRRRERVLEIAVEDAGPGIPPDKAEEVFRPFVQLDPARNRDLGGGVGLGLSIARDIARGHGGEVILESGPRGGTRAVLRLPV